MYFIIFRCDKLFFIRCFLAFKFDCSDNLLELLREVKYLNKSIFIENGIRYSSLYGKGYLLICLEGNNIQTIESYKKFFEMFSCVDYKILFIEKIESFVLIENSFTYVSKKMFSFLKRKNVIGFNLFDLNQEILNELFEYIKNITVNKSFKPINFTHYF